MTRPTDAQKNLTIPAWVFTFGKWLIGIAIVLALADLGWRGYVTEKVSNIPKMQQSLDKIEQSQEKAVDELHDHVTDHDAHPNLDRLSTQIENLDRTIQTRSVVVDKKLDSIDESMRRQWEAISEIRKRTAPQ